MAAGAFTVLDIAKPKFINGGFDFDSHTFKLALCGATQALSAAFTGSSGDGRYADLTDEMANGNGYTTGGKTLTTLVVSITGSSAYFDADDVTWAAITKTGIKYGVLYDDTHANKAIVGFFELNAGGTISPVGNDLSVLWNAAGIFTLT